MAKINARGCRRIGPRLYTERWLLDGQPVSDGRAEGTMPPDGATLFRQSWQLRSDGAVLEHIVWTETPSRPVVSYRSSDKAHPGRLTHNGADSIVGSFKNPEGIDISRLEAWLEARRYTIVERSYR